MNLTVKFSFVLIVLFFASCNKNDFEPNYSQGKALAIKNGKDWMGQAGGVIDRQGVGIDFYYDVFDDSGQLRERLGFSKVPYAIGNHRLFENFGHLLDSLPTCNYTTISFDGDVVEDRYKVVEVGDESIVTVTDYDESEKLLSGEFKIKLYIDPDRPKSNPSNPDTILFEVGEFEVTIEE